MKDHYSTYQPVMEQLHLKYQVSSNLKPLLLDWQQPAVPVTLSYACMHADGHKGKDVGLSGERQGCFRGSLQLNGSLLLHVRLTGHALLFPPMACRWAASRTLFSPFSMERAEELALARAKVHTCTKSPQLTVHLQKLNLQRSGLCQAVFQRSLPTHLVTDSYQCVPI